MSDDNNPDQEIDFNNPKIQAYLEEQTRGLKTKNSELLGKFGELKDFKQKFEGVDVDQILQFAEKAKQEELTKKLSEGKFDEVLAQKTDLMRSNYEQKLSEQTSRAQTLESKVLNGFIATYAAQAGVQPEAIDLVNMLAQSQFKLDASGDPVAVNAQGEVINGKDGKTPLTVTDWLASLRETKPILWGTPQGSSAPGNKGGGGTKKPNEMNQTERADWQKNDPEGFAQAVASGAFNPI